MNRSEVPAVLDVSDLERLWGRVEHLVDTVPCNYHEARLMAGYPDEPSELPTDAAHTPVSAQQPHQEGRRNHSGIGPQYGEEARVGYVPNQSGDVVFPRVSTEQAARNTTAIAGIRAALEAKG